VAISYIPPARPVQSPAAVPLAAISVRSRGHGPAEWSVIAASGEVDASNAKDFALAVCAAAAGHRQVAIDLSELSFLAVDGVTALHAIHAQLIRDGAAWEITANAPVRRVLELCDPAGVLPRVAATAAVHLVGADPHHPPAAAPCLPDDQPEAEPAAEPA
jgi:anti-anti-sigma regulatory factor